VNDERRRRIEEICDDALNHPVGERAAFVAAACADDETLRHEVEALLLHAQTAEGFLAAPVAAVAAAVFSTGSTLLAGVEIGSYRIVGSLGAGAMGEVYRARDAMLKRDVAIKVLPAAFADDAERLARFKREAQALASLNHPNIAHVYGLEHVDHVRESGLSSVAIVMELVEGETLADLLERRVPSIVDTLSMARQIAAALDATHEKGLVHRDLKPANIKITPGGAVKVLDFGLAKPVVRDSPGPVSTPRTVAATTAGTIVGTIAYMSPEQARGERVDKRTDIWAFGCVLYEMLTGRTPFGADGLAGTLAAVLEREPDWSSLPDAVDPRVTRLVRRCLEKDPSRRLRDIGDARAELEEVRDTSVQPGPASRPVQRRGIAVALVALVAAGGVGVWVSRRDASPQMPTEVRLEINAPPTRDLTSIAISSDGLRVAAIGDASPNSRVWVREVSSGTSRFLEGTEGASLPFWSPDGRSLGFFADNKLKRIDLDAGTAQSLADAPNPQGGSWGADGTILFAPTQITPIMRVSASGGMPQAVTRMQAAQVGHLFPRFLPDGTHFLYAVTGTPQVRGVYIDSLADAATRRILPEASAATLSSSGYLLFASDDTLFAQKFDPGRMEPVGDRTRVADTVATDRTVAGGPPGLAASAAAAGPIAYRARPAQDDHQLIWFDRAGNELTRLGAPLAAGLNPALSPDGRHLALSRVVDGNRDIWVLDLERNVFSRFTFDPANENAPLWTPDGRWIIFASTRRGVLNIFRKPVAGGDEEPLVITKENINTGDISADGRMMFFSQADPHTLRDLWVKPLEPAAPPFPVVQTPNQDLNGQFAPNASGWLAYQSNQSGRHEVSLRTLDGTGPAIQVSSDGGTQPRWRRDGRELFYLGLDRQLMAVPVAFSPNGQSVKVGTPFRLFQTRIGGANTLQGEYLVSPDGQRFLLDTPIRDVTPPITMILNWRPR
jgi:serine/threonine protein kinase